MTKRDSTKVENFRISKHELSGERIHGTIANQLGAAILNGQYAPGDTLTGEIAFAKQLNVSRTAYREALQILTAKGLVDSRPKTGTRVLPRSHWNLLDPEVLAWAFQGEPDFQLVRSLFELRTAIEPVAAGLSAERHNDLQLDAIKNSVEAMRMNTIASNAWSQADRDFHRHILLASQNDAFIALSASIESAIHWTTHYKQRSQGGLARDPFKDHLNVYTAIAKRDAKAATRNMRSLIALALADTQHIMNN